MINRKDLHKVEMDLAYLFDENKLTREDIIKAFTGLMSDVIEIKPILKDWLEKQAESEYECLIENEIEEDNKEDFDCRIEFVNSIYELLGDDLVTWKEYRKDVLEGD